MSTTPESFICPITSEIMADPVSTADGFSYEREAILEWFAGGNNTSPITGAPLGHQHVVPNHALRSAIQEFVNANPAVAKDLYRPQQLATTTSAASASSAATPPPMPRYPNSDVSDSMATSGCGGVSDASPVPVGLPVTPVQAPPTPPLAGLTESDLAACAPYKVLDWKVYSMPPKAAAGGWFDVFKVGKAKPKGAAADGAFAQAVPSSPRAGADLAAGEPLVRVSAVDGGGVALNAEISSVAQLHRLAMRLAAPGSSPIAALRIATKDGFGPGTAAPIEATGEGSELLCRALFSASQSGGVVATNGVASSLAGLRELAISKMVVSDATADRLSQALSGHPVLASLELYNVNLEDPGARSIARLARPDGNQALTKLSLGKHCMLGETIQELEERVIDKERVHAQLY